MITITTYTLEKDSGERQTITIDPVLIGVPGAKHFTGVYRLLETDMTGKELGELAFHLHDSGQWQFIGEYFTENEQEKIVEFIKEQEPIDSFAFLESDENGEHHFRITDNEGHFAVEKDGVFIAVIEHNEDWEQVGGKPLDEEMLRKITSRIEQHND